MLAAAAVGRQFEGPRRTARGGLSCYSAAVKKQKISANPAIDAALRLDGDPRRVQAFYEDWAQSYDLDVSSAGYSAPSICAGLLQQQLADTSATLLDAGCGSGLVGVELEARGYRNLDGFDLSESMAEKARATGCYRRVRGGVDMMQAAREYDASSYAAVISAGVFTLGHVPPRALEVLLQLVAAPGLLIVSTRSLYYEQSDFQQVVDDLLARGCMESLRLLENAPYNDDGAGHYWVFRKTG